MCHVCGISRRYGWMVIVTSRFAVWGVTILLRIYFSRKATAAPPFHINHVRPRRRPQEARAGGADRQGSPEGPLRRRVCLPLPLCPPPPLTPAVSQSTPRPARRSATSSRSSSPRSPPAKRSSTSVSSMSFLSPSNAALTTEQGRQARCRGRRSSVEQAQERRQGRQG